MTYGNQGTAKSGAKYKDHAIIYTGSQAPQELPDENKLLKKPVRVDTYSDSDSLSIASRVNYAKLYTIEHNIKVCFIGKIHKDSEHIFFTEVRRIFDESDEGEGKSERKSEGKTKEHKGKR